MVISGCVSDLELYAMTFFHSVLTFVSTDYTQCLVLLESVMYSRQFADISLFTHAYTFAYSPSTCMN